MSPELKARILKTRYQPTTVGNMMIDPEGGYCSFEAVEILRFEIEALKQQVEQGKRDAVPTTAALDVLAERYRQKSVEGWTNDHDDQHIAGEIAVAAGCYVLSGSGKWPKEALWNIWPKPNWSLTWFKPKTKRQDLVRAGALILAEIERIDRAAAPKQEK
ncbi:MAG: hypothetical protein WBK19_10300 [Azonexus sp.]